MGASGLYILLCFALIHDTPFLVSLGFLFVCYVPEGMIKSRHGVLDAFLQRYDSPLQKQESSDCSRHLVHQASNDSRASITESLSEFFDAQEVLLSASSSENEVRTFMPFKFTAPCSSYCVK